MRTSRTKGRRTERVASLIGEVVSTEIVTGLSDPRLAFVTVTGVTISPDLRYADVRISILGDAKTQRQCLRAINHAHGRIQKKVAQALVTRTCPICRFHVDESVKRSVSLGALIAKARAEDEANRADRIRRGVEPGGELPPVEESPPEPLDADAKDAAFEADDDPDEDEDEDEEDEDEENEEEEEEEEEEETDGPDGDDDDDNEDFDDEDPEDRR
jgi:ribosome-binding factor A